MAELPYPRYRYCIDTSSLIELKSVYPKDVHPFHALWENMEQMIKKGRLLTAREVVREIERYDAPKDILVRWVKKNRKMAIGLNREQLALVGQIMSQYPGLVDPNRENPKADPFVIALAKTEGCTVVTQESQIKPNRIPEVCRKLDVKYMSLVEFFSEQHWA